jgi:hypothetical protein
MINETILEEYRSIPYMYEMEFLRRLYVVIPVRKRKSIIGVQQGSRKERGRNKEISKASVSYGKVASLGGETTRKTTEFFDSGLTS